MRYSILSIAALLPLSFAQLNELAKAKGLVYFGSATDNGELSDAPYVDILSNTSEFGQITPGNTQKWQVNEPNAQGVFDFSKGDVVVKFAEANNQALRCHALVWHSQLPSWITGGTWTKETLTAAMKNHITEVVTHYKGRCYAWDVVNEAFEGDGSYQDNIFHQIIGTEYIPIAFETAAAADPDVKLYYNDFSFEAAGEKSAAILNLVNDLKARSIKIDGVGFQGHFVVGSAPSLEAQTSNLQSFVDAGVEVAYTELDVRFSSLPATDAGYAQQATDYVSAVQACLNVRPGCAGLTIWDFTDKYSWVPSTFSGNGEALPWNADFTLKPAYFAMVKALSDASGVSTTVPVAVPSTSVIASIESSTTSAVAAITPASSVVSTTQLSVTATAPSSIPASVTATTLLSVTKAPISSTSTPAVPSTPVVIVEKWGQCGGSGFTGSTICACGSTCTFQNDWYSQCL
ncbi:glycosyl hydrolase family 10 [Phlyctema vagabunda]|uniref:Beta-xylanase n=1 Tax=Phlyctema vagabunda TaxID=108571 RepID=A0ABR4PTR0_9HELO